MYASSTFFRVLATAGLAAIEVICGTRVLAHVRVFPEIPNATAQACSYAKFVVRVPVEKTIATTGVRVVIPKGVVVFAAQPKAGWKVDFGKDRGRISAVRWSGGTLEPHEFDEFTFLAATPSVPQTLDWDADQTYADGSVVHWTGKPGSETPHSQTRIVANDSGCREMQKKR